MPERLFDKQVILAKAEVTYGVDPTPTGAANAVLAVNGTIEPLAGTDLDRQLMRPFLGHDGLVLTDHHVMVSFEVEIAGSGAAGTAPAWGPLVRAAGFAETVNAGTSVVYAPISGAFPSMALYFFMDGKRHVLVGARTRLSGSLRRSEIPRFTFSAMGLLGTVSDTANPAAVYTAWKDPVAVHPNNTTLALHGFSGPAESLSFDLGVELQHRPLINLESIALVDRRATGQAVLEDASIAAKDWLAISRAGTRAAMLAVHGGVAGNIVEFGAPKVQIGRPSYANSQKIVAKNLPLIFTPDAGNDEFTITAK